MSIINACTNYLIVGLFLAGWTIKRRALPLHDLFNCCAAYPARLAGAAIHPIVLLKVAWLAVAVGKVAQRAAALRDGGA